MSRSGTSGSVGLLGLVNSGVTCYLNSLLQTLYFTPEFRHAIYSLDQNSLFQSDSTKSQKPRALLQQLLYLFVRLQSRRSSSALSTVSLTSTFGWNSSQLNSQQDVCELNRLLLDVIDRSLKSLSFPAVIADCYSGSLIHVIRCSRCSFESERAESFIDIPVTVSGHFSLLSSLASFVTPECLDGSNQYNCSACRLKSDATRWTRFFRLPPVMLFALNRFEYDLKKGTREKLTHRFEFPQSLSMNEYCSREISSSRDSTDYQLSAVITHSGSAFRGHYHAIVRDCMKEGNWNKIKEPVAQPKKNNSNQSKPQSSAAVTCSSPVASKRRPSDPPVVSQPWNYLDESKNDKAVRVLRDTLLLYSESDFTCSLDDLCASMTAFTNGESWKKVFKPKYGAIKQFIEKFDQIFAISDAEQIHLIARPMQSDALEKLRAEAKLSELESKIEKLTVSEVPIEEKIEIPEEKEEIKEEEKTTNEEEKNLAALPISEQDCSPADFRDPDFGWFDFNDSSVSAVTAADVERQFGSTQAKECAYLLVYRRKQQFYSFQPPIIPEIIPAMELREQKAAEELKERELMEKHGFSILIAALGKKSDGDHINNHSRSSRFSQSYGINYYSLKILKSWPAERLRSLIANTVGVDEKSLLAHKAVNKGESKLINLNGDATIESIGINSKTELLVSSSESSKLILSEHEFRQSGIFRFQIETENSNPLKRDSPHILIVDGQNYQNLDQIRLLLFDAIGIENPKNPLVGRFKTAAGKLLVNHEISISELGIPTLSTLKFDPIGRRPASTECYLFVQPATRGVANCDFIPSEHQELIIDRSMTIRELLRRSISLFNIPADIVSDCSLVRLNSKGVAVQPLADLNESIQNINFNFAELIHLETIRNIPDGHFLLTASFRNIGGNSAESKSINQDETDSSICPPHRLDPSELISLPPLELPESLTLGELKTLIADIPMIADSGSPHHFRVRLLTAAGQFGQILRDDRRTMSDYKINSGAKHLLFDKLAKSELLDTAASNFFIARRHVKIDSEKPTIIAEAKTQWKFPDLPNETMKLEDSHGNPSSISLFGGNGSSSSSGGVGLLEFQLRKSAVPSLAALQLLFHEQLFPDIPAERLLIAYYKPNEFTYRQLRESKPKPKRKKKGARNNKTGKRKVKESMNNNTGKGFEFPNLVDGTLLIVKDSNSDPDSLDDWRTEFDRAEWIKFQEENPEAATNEKRERNEEMKFNMEFDEEDDEDEEDDQE